MTNNHNVSLREREVLYLIAYEHTTKEVASRLFISKHTADTHRKNLLQKLRVKNTAGLIRVGFEKGILQIAQVAMIFLCCLTSTIYAQQEVEIRVDGVVMSRTTTDMVVDPVEGMMIYDTMDSVLKIYNGVIWKSIGADSLVPWMNITGIPAGFSDGTDDIKDADFSTTNEIQDLSLSGTTLSLSSDLTTVDLGDISPFSTNSVLIKPSSSHLDKDFVIGASKRLHIPHGGGLDSFYMYYDVSKSAYRGGIILNQLNWSEDSLGMASFAHGVDLLALGEASTALGISNKAYGAASIVGGEGSRSIGNHSFAFGQESETHGNRGSVAMGDHVLSHGKASIAVGRFNDPIVNVNQNVNSLSPMFIVGNGSQTLRKNAMLVRKDGHTGINTSDPTHTLTVMQDTCANYMTEGFALKDTVSKSEWVFTIDCDGVLVISYNDTPITALPPQDVPGGGWQPYPISGDPGIVSPSTNSKSKPAINLLSDLKLEMEELSKKLKGLEAQLLDE